MQECETGTGKSSSTKRVTVRSGGAGHAHSGVVKSGSAVTKPGSGNGRATPQRRADGKIVRLGR